MAKSVIQGLEKSPKNYTISGEIKNERTLAWYGFSSSIEKVFLRDTLYNLYSPIYFTITSKYSCFY